DKRQRLLNGQLDVNRRQMSGLVQSLLTAEDLPRKNQRLRLGASVGQPARHEQLVQAFFAGLRFHFETSQNRCEEKENTEQTEITEQTEKNHFSQTLRQFRYFRLFRILSRASRSEEH